MLTLAIELSSRRGSVALGRDGVVLAADAWEAAQARGERVFSAIERLIQSCDIMMDQVELFVAGRGPGGFSGIRMAVTVAQALAMPTGRPVRAISSGWAMAEQVRAEFPAAPIGVVGDARRGTWWWSWFHPDGRMARDWSAASPDEVLRSIPPDARIATSDWDRIAGHPGIDVRWNPGPVWPDASTSLRLSHRQQIANEPSEPLLPIYLHPAVAS